jgi:hypothetical protein
MSDRQRIAKVGPLCRHKGTTVWPGADIAWPGAVLGWTDGYRTVVVGVGVLVGLPL